MSAEKIEILNRVASGALSVEEGNRLLAELDAHGSAPSEGRAPDVSLPLDTPEVILPPETSDLDSHELERMKAWKRWNWIPLTLFLILTGFAGLWIYQSYRSGGFGWGFWLSWIPFLIGVLGIYAFWNMKWVHVRVRERKAGRTQRVSISIPLPLGVLPWVFQTFGCYMPSKVREHQESILMINDALKSDEPIHIQVSEDEDEEVEVFIG